MLFVLMETNMTFYLFRLGMWVDCSLSPLCSPSCSAADSCSVERLACSDRCVEDRLEARRRLMAEQMTGSSQLAILASPGVSPSVSILILLSSFLVSVISSL